MTTQDTFNRSDRTWESKAFVRINDQEVSGQLHFSPDNGTTFDYLESPTASLLSKLNLPSFEILTGTLASGQHITLLDCFTTNQSGAFSGHVSSRIIANQLLAGHSLNDAGERAFDRIGIELSDFRYWRECNATSLTDSFDKSGNLASTTISVVRPPPIQLSLDTDDIIVSIEGGIAYNDRLFHAATVDYEPFVRIKSKQPLNLDECDAETYKVQAFFSLLYGRQAFCRSVRLSTPKTQDNSPANTCEYLPRFPQPNRLTSSQHFHFLPFTIVAEQIQSLWRKWNTNFSSYDRAISLYMSPTLFSGQVSNFEFLAIMQALETFHRSCRDGLYMNQQQYDAIVATMKKAMPPHLPSPLRDSLGARLKYGNEHSLRKRVALLASELPLNIHDALSHDLQAVLNRAVGTRNYLTHYSSELETESFKDVDLYYVTTLLRWFFAAILLCDLDLPPQMLEKALRSSAALSHAREKIRTIPAQAGG
jgi:hypothetical protein